MSQQRYADRRDAGRRLAARLTSHAGPGSVVLGLPRGGVPVADEVARAIHSGLDLLLVRKLGVPWQPELAMGAVGEGGVRVVNDDVVESAGISPRHLDDVASREERVIADRATLYRCGHGPPDLHGRTAILVDDGLATGATMRAACRVARLRGARRVVVAVPVAPADWAIGFKGLADELVCPLVPEAFSAVGVHYVDFGEVADEVVVSVLSRSRSESCDVDVTVNCGDASLPGHLSVPLGATGCIAFAHGSGSSRHSVRNRRVAGRLNADGFATLLLDLLSEDEAARRESVFDVDLLARRLGGTVSWLNEQPRTSGLPIGLFGASTGAAAALVEAATDASVRAVVSRGGRPDLAWDFLPAVRQPVLLLVGSRDPEVLEMNRRAAERLGGPHSLSVVSAAGHLFEEPGTLDVVAERASAFFSLHVK